MSTVFFTLYALWKSALFDGANAVHGFMGLMGGVYYLPWTRMYALQCKLCGTIWCSTSRCSRLIYCFGSRDDRVAEHAAWLCREYRFGLVMVSGGAAHQNDLLTTKWSEPTEAEHFMNVMRSSGYGEHVLLEDRATNTGENATLSYELLEKQRSTPKGRLLIVTKPYMERRALATFEAQWPEKTTQLSVTSPQLNLSQYINNDQPFDDVVNIMIGDLQRIIDYPARGFQSEQYVPKQVLAAAELLKRAGYTKHL